jgi:glycine cleavage system H lipoate-binding protein
MMRGHNILRIPYKTDLRFGGRIAVMDGYKYAKSHEYAKVDGDVATVGISDFAQVSFGVSNTHALQSVFVAAALVTPPPIDRSNPDGFLHPLQSELGDVVYVELPEVGATVTQGETFGVVESVKVCGSCRGRILTISTLRPLTWCCTLILLVIPCWRISFPRSPN